jgi:3-keto-disaccharide hydrolase
MRKRSNRPDRRAFLATGLTAAGAAAVARCFPLAAYADDQANAPISLFDGTTLDGWIQLQNSDWSVGGGDITDLPSLAKKLAEKPDAVSAFLADQLDDATKASLAAYSASITGSAEAPAAAAGAPNPAARAAASAIGRWLTKIIAGPSIYDMARFKSVVLRSETSALLGQNPHGRDLAKLNRMLLEDAYPGELSKGVATGWIVKEGAMASTGASRGVIYTAEDYGHFRLIFTMRHISGDPDHPACVLVFCTRPAADEIPLDALAGIQFQVPTADHWDYRPGHNNSGPDFTLLAKPMVDPHEWSRIEILADASTGIARMAVAQPVGTKAIEVLDFKNAAAGKVGPIALQIHNGGLFDEYKDITIEVNPKVDDLITTG